MLVRKEFLTFMMKEKQISQNDTPLPYLLLLIQSHLCSHPPLLNHYHPLHTNQHHYHQWNHPQLHNRVQEHLWQSTIIYPKSHQGLHLQPYGILLSLGFGQKKMNERQIFCFVHGYLPCGVSVTNQSIIDITYLCFITIILFHRYSMES